MAHGTRMTLVLCLLGAVGLSAGVARAGLVGYWPMSEGSGATTADASGTGNTGTLGSAAAWTGAGKFGSALDFDGTVNSYVDMGAPASLDLTSAVTVSAWVKRGTTTGTHQPIVGKGDFQYMIRSSGSGEIQFFTYDGGWHQVNGATIAEDEWHYVTGVCDGSNVRVYVDGGQGGSAAGGITSDPAAVNIGRNSSHTDRVFSGTIDDVAVWDRALSVSEIGLLSTGSYQPNNLPTSSKGISINFSGGSPSDPGPFNVTASTGVFDMPNWNNVAGSAGSLGNLLDADGTPTSAGASWTCPNTWANTSWPDDGGIGSLFRSYLDTNDQGPPGGAAVTITNLPPEYAAGYDVLVYFDGGGTGRFGDYTVDDGLKSVTLVGNDAANNLNGFAFDDGTSADSGNFLLFEDFHGLNLRITSSALATGQGGGFRAPINGVQIVWSGAEIPEPATAALLAFAAAGLGGYVRKRRRA